MNHSTRSFAFAVLAVLSAAMPLTASAQDATLRPIDRSTVRVLAVRGLSPGARLAGVVTASSNVRSGSGLAVSPDLVVTAAHVVEGGRAVLVEAPSGTRTLPARVVYVHPSLDVALLRVDGTLPHHTALGRDRPLALSEPVSVSGYPGEVSETTPAATSGEIARVARDGRLQLAISVNPGFSGGPVIDRRGRPIGIITAREDPRRGVEGVAWAIPAAPIREAIGAAAETQPEFTRGERLVATVFSHREVLRQDERVIARAAYLGALRDAAAEPVDAVSHSLLAGVAWNAGLQALSDGHESAPELLAGARALASRALSETPGLSLRFPALHHIVTLDPTAPPPPEAHELQASR